jgi:hypothetical protein
MPCKCRAFSFLALGSNVRFDPLSDAKTRTNACKIGAEMHGGGRFVLGSIV